MSAQSNFSASTILSLGRLLLVREMRVLLKMWATKFRAKAGGANARVARDKTHARQPLQTRATQFCCERSPLDNILDQICALLT